jgi:hypothetical protein
LVGVDTPTSSDDAAGSPTGDVPPVYQFDTSPGKYLGGTRTPRTTSASASSSSGGNGAGATVSVSTGHTGVYNFFPKVPRLSGNVVLVVRAIVYNLQYKCLRTISMKTFGNSLQYKFCLHFPYRPSGIVHEKPCTPRGISYSARSPWDFRNKIFQNSHGHLALVY